MQKLQILVFLLIPVTALCAEKSFSGSEENRFPADYREVDNRTEQVKGIQKYAVDAQAGAQKNFGVQAVHDNEIFSVFRADRLEYQTNEGKDFLLWDVIAWIGSDYNKLYLESEGTWMIEKEKFEEAEIELLYGRAISSFWDLQIGIRHDFKPRPTRTFAALGIQGMAPYWFEVDMTAYISDYGDVSASLEIEYDLLLTQRLILQPRLETRFAAHEVKKHTTGRGFNSLEIGARLRYEIHRKFAPYIGISWSRKLGETEDLFRDKGKDIDSTSFVVGVKLWF